jgi:hypothetical protein
MNVCHLTKLFTKSLANTSGKPEYQIFLGYNSDTVSSICGKASIIWHLISLTIQLQKNAKKPSVGPAPNISISVSDHF